jgi:hypothetical protein
LVVVFVTGVVGAQVSTIYEESFHVLDGGGGRSEDTHFAMDSGIGLPVVGYSESTHFALESGYTPLGGGGAVYKVYLPLAVRD